MRRGEDVRTLRHEVNAAEHDELGLGMRRAVLREAIRVPGDIGEPDYLIALIVVPEDEQAGTECCLCSRDAAIEFLVREAQIPIGKRLPLTNRGLLDVGQQGEKRSSHDCAPSGCEKFRKPGRQKRSGLEPAIAAGT